MPRIEALDSAGLRIVISDTGRIDSVLMNASDTSLATQANHRAQHALFTSWDDLQFAPDAFNPQGAASDPTFDQAVVPGTFLFSGTTENLLTAIRQVPHRWQAGSTMRPHIHWEKTTTGSGDPLWQWCYTIANVGDVFPAYSAWINATNAVPHSNTVRKHALDTFPDLVMTGKRESCIICIQLRRLPSDPLDTYVANARFLEFDIHYLSDKDGTEDEYPQIG
jgi:hypothetical protein